MSRPTYTTTFAAAWRERWADLRERARECVPPIRIETDERAGYVRDCLIAWEREVTDAAWDGAEIAAPVWRSIERHLGRERWVYLQQRNNTGKMRWAI